MGKGTLDFSTKKAVNTVDARINAVGADIKFIQPYGTKEEIYLNPENVFDVLTIHDAGGGVVSRSSRVMSREDTDIMDRASRIREKYIFHMLTDPDNVSPIPGTPVNGPEQPQPKSADSAKDGKK